jgi:lantibiotic modifying enzyme
VTWTPLLDGPARERALQTVGAIANDLREQFSGDVDEPEAWSLAAGRSGVALFFAYYGSACANDAAHAFAVQLVQDALEAAAGAAPLQHLFEGFTGVGWTLAHLDGWLLDLSEGDPNDALDAALLELVSTTPWSGEFDLLAGLTGVGVYALERRPRARALELLSEVVDRLAELDARQPFWWLAADRLPADVRARYSAGAWNLGTAHGVPGVVALLWKAHAAGMRSATPLLERAVDWLLAQRRGADAECAFPSFTAPDVVAGRSPLAWCYGDPGTAGALFGAAPEAATAVIERAATRPVLGSGVVDASICHGSAGLAHIFNRLHQATGSEALRQTAREWLQQLVEMPRREAGFLTGAAGSGLALLAAATPLEPRWDRALLLS